MKNTLYNMSGLPLFTDIAAADIKPTVETIIEENKKQIDKVLSETIEPTWESVIEPIDLLNVRLSEVWSPVGHLNAVMNNDELRDAYNSCLPLLSEYGTALGQNEKLFNAVKTISESSAYAQFDIAQKKTIENQLRDFHLSGVDLPQDKKQRYGEIKKRLSELSSRFSENVLDATQAWSKLITDEKDLSGLPQSALDSARSAAKQKQQEGYRLTLDFPSYFAVVTYADDRELRKEIYSAFCTRASDQGIYAGDPDGKWDNSAIMQEILQLRTELAHVLGFDSYANYSLATKMAETPEQVIGFLEDLAAKSKAQAQKEYEEICEFAKESAGITDLQAWDLPYFSEKLKQKTYTLSQEELRPFFPAPKVMEGMFNVVNRLYGIECRENKSVNLWHKDAHYFDVLDEQGKVIAGFYLDLYARENKRGGAWMDECKVRHFGKDRQLQTPVAYLTCNFTPPVDDKPSLLTHNEVTTLFHEFGHGLHHMLTRISYPSVSGINGVAWDAVELPSQFMENWCWQKESIDLISGHFETGEPLPQEMLGKMLSAKNFQSAMFMLRQLEFAIFDMKLHIQAAELKSGDSIDIQGVLDSVRQQIAVAIPPSFNRFQHSFTHVFGGGYAAGYYSYKWAEVLSADAFSRFEAEGIFNKATGESFKAEILEQGGAKEPMELFKAFMGREPSVDALLRHAGIG